MCVRFELIQAKGGDGRMRTRMASTMGLLIVAALLAACVPAELTPTPTSPGVLPPTGNETETPEVTPPEIGRASCRERV